VLAPFAKRKFSLVFISDSFHICSGALEAQFIILARRIDLGRETALKKYTCN
jgi:hypothetical protein